MMLAMKKLVIAALIQGASASATVLTGASFDAEVLHPTRSAFVLFYAPWCGHCKAMKPAWGEFGKLHAKSAELLVGEVDCTDPTGGGEALCERFEVEGFPTLKFFEAGSAEPEEFGAILVHERMFTDHLPSLYETALRAVCAARGAPAAAGPQAFARAHTHT